MKINFYTLISIKMNDNTNNIINVQLVQKRIKTWAEKGDGNKVLNLTYLNLTGYQITSRKM